MKINRIVKGLLALFVATGFTFTSCAPEADGGLPADAESSLTLTGRVYTNLQQDQDGNYYYTALENANSNILQTAASNTLTFVNTSFGRGQIKNGHLNITLTEPQASELVFLTSNLAGTFLNIHSNAPGGTYNITNASNPSYYDPLSPNPTTAVRYAIVDNMTMTNPNGTLTRSNISGSDSKYTEEKIIYIYVDKGITIMADGDKDTSPGTATSPTRTWDYKNVSLTLTGGWNAIYIKYDYTFTPGSTTDNYTINTSETITKDSPDLKWVY